MAAERGDVLVIVDVLSFSSAVATAVNFGGIIVPCRDSAEARAAVLSRRGVIEAVRRDSPDTAPYSLSPPTYIGIEAGTTVALASPNGASCCRLAVDGGLCEGGSVYAGCLLNAEAVARRGS